MHICPTSPLHAEIIVGSLHALISCVMSRSASKSDNQVSWSAAWGFQPSHGLYIELWGGRVCSERPEYRFCPTVQDSASWRALQ